MRPKIIWTFWRDPLAEDPDREWADESEWPGPSRDGGGWGDDRGRGGRFAAAGREEDGPEGGRAFIATDAGLVTPDVYHSMLDAFDLWVGDTTFELDDDVALAIETFPGVETLDVLTRYRFRVGFGRAFDGEAVRRGIEELVGASRFSVEADDGTKFPPEVEARALAAARSLGGKCPFWALYVAPNGSICCSHGDDPGPVSENLDVYRKARAAVGGAIYLNAE